MSKIYFRSYLTLLLVIFIFENAKADWSCTALFFPEKRVLFQDKTKVIDSFMQPDGSIWYLRKTLVGLEQSRLLLTTDPKIMAEALTLLISTGRHKLWLHYMYRLRNLYKMPEKVYQLQFPDIKRNRSALKTILDFFGVSIERSQWKNSIPWKNEKTLVKHYEKHGLSEFNAQSPQEYSSMAASFANRPDGDSRLTFQIREDTIWMYDLITFEILIIDSGSITSYYKLTEVYRMQTLFDSYVAEALFR